MTKKPDFRLYQLARHRGYKDGMNDAWDEGIGDFDWGDVFKLFEAADKLQDQDYASIAYRLAAILPPPATEEP